jgi:hypothetical protein
LNITQVFLKKVISEVDSDTWVQVRPHYLPAEYHSVYKIINKYFEDHSRLPSFDALKLSVRSDVVLNKIYAISLAEDVDLPNSELLEYVKNQYAQEEILDQISKYLEESIMIDSAKDNITHLSNIIAHVEDRVDMKDPEEDMNRIELFDSEEDLSKAFSLGLNSDFDSKFKFGCTDYILIGGVRGTGKSLTCSNIAVHAYEQLQRSSIYFTIEMTPRAVLQRNCAIATGIPASKMRSKTLSVEEWRIVAKWWSGRFTDGEKAYEKYLQHRSFDELHGDLSRLPLLEEKQLDIVYDPSMTLATIRSELDKKVERLKPAVILVDYVNQVSRFGHRKMGQYDWTEQIEVSKALKAIAQEYEIPVVSPYQIDATGEARFAKGLLDSADAAFTLDAHKKEDECITFKCVKMRDNEEVDFTSKMNWSTLKMGPEPAQLPEKETKEKSSKSNNSTGEDVYDL